MKYILRASLTSLTLLLTACSGFFDKDNTPPPTPLVSFTPSIAPKQLWYTNVNNGVGSDYIKLSPSLDDQKIFTADKTGTVTATEKATGKNLWKASIREAITAGPTAHHDLVFVGTRNGKIFALQQANGGAVWNTQLSSEVLAAPAASNNIVLVKTIDGQLTALAENDGHTLWHYQQIEPALILRGASAPQISHDIAVVGFENGNLVKLTLDEGSQLWQQTVAVPQGSFAIQRMVDIDADPVIFGNTVYVATYQGRIAALDLTTVRNKWTHDISSYTGLAVDEKQIYISDATSHVWTFNAESGATDWRQTKLEARNITAPATIGDYIVVGDAEGYLHWLSKQDGHFVARVRVNNGGILAAPVVDNNIVYVLTKDGHLAAYTLG
jgi:outer membrane protein assembly factor BamB